MLVKLIDRETGQTSYELVKQLRGSFVAFMWQGLARLFDHDLKAEYDPEGTDATMEIIVQRIERGELFSRRARRPVNFVIHAKGVRYDRLARREFFGDGFERGVSRLFGFEPDRLATRRGQRCATPGERREERPD